MTLTLSPTSGRAITLMVLMLSICFASCTNTQSANIVSLKQIGPDMSCGPECLVAFMRLTGEGNPECAIKCIYELIGKEPFSDTTLKDLKDAAQKLGFSANGYKLTVTDLEKITGYAILPVGNAAGTADDPQHFILVKQVVKDDVTIINTRTLKAQTIAVSDLQNAWKGYALVISWR
jgi:ABC-type bacteriocin/lantibiotic exporter with double-glycine peptidase domain